MIELVKWRYAGKAYLTEVGTLTVVISVHPNGGWQWCTNHANGPSGYDPGLASAKTNAVEFTVRRSRGRSSRTSTTRRRTSSPKPSPKSAPPWWRGCENLEELGRMIHSGKRGFTLVCFSQGTSSAASTAARRGHEH